MKRKDIKLLSCIICVLLILLISRFIRSGSHGAYVRIIQAGRETGLYPLNVDTDIELIHNTIHIEGGRVSVTKADCPDRLCIKQGGIHKPGQTIACLPNRTVIQIVASNSSSGSSPITYSGIHFDTLVDVKIYDFTEASAIKEAELTGLIDNECKRYELICSRTNPDSELYRLNHRLITDCNSLEYGEATLTSYKVSSDLYDMIAAGLTAYTESDGRFDISVAPLSELWDFKSGDNIIPDASPIDAALPHIGADNILLCDDGYIAFTDDAAMIDLGGLAKGYIGDRLKTTLKSNGVTSAIISLGGNVVAIGDKGGSPFTVGIRRPFDDTGSISTAVSATDTSVITSGTYERYFITDGILYHHILDPSTGYPYDTDLSSATVICDSSLQGDILSTVLLSEGSKTASLHADTLLSEGIRVILMDSDGNLIYDSVH